ncbi:MAG: ribosome-binding factor A [Saprospiraceae bacterium]|nr:MAG: ribosome-binding factor A [Saprospiraceae bacterium]
METKRQKQVAETIKRHFSEVLLKEGSYVYGAEPLVTVTTVKVTPDLSLAKIYLSIYNTENKQAVILNMEDQITQLRQSLAVRLRKHLRRTPEIAVFEDDTLDEMYRMNDLFNRLHQDNQMGSADEEE